MSIRRILLATVVSTATLGLVGPARAYPVDCAILLCLAGGWPANPVCAHAKAVFVTRLTPWPVEPPLQIWRCPMGGGAAAAPSRLGGSALGDDSVTGSTAPMMDVPRSTAEGSRPLSTPQVDVDISNPAFDAVRSIRVYHVAVRPADHRRRRGRRGVPDVGRLAPRHLRHAGGLPLDRGPGRLCALGAGAIGLRPAPQLRLVSLQIGGGDMDRRARRPWLRRGALLRFDCSGAGAARQH